ncbi:MAG: hypothetical protein R2690_12350 [Acidimicrobiales bacterium]
MLGLLEGVPLEHLTHRRGADGVAQLFVAQHQLAEGGGEVLDGGGDGEAPDLGCRGVDELHQGEGDLLAELRAVAELGQAVVEHAVLTAVDRLLPDEAGDLALEHRVGDLVAVVAHRADEEVLAVGEQRRQHGDDVAGQHVAVAGEVLGQVGERLLEGDAAGGDRTIGVEVWTIWSIGTSTSVVVLGQAPP